MTHEMKLRGIYFEKIKSGEKIYEIRFVEGLYNDHAKELVYNGYLGK